MVSQYWDTCRNPRVPPISYVPQVIIIGSSDGSDGGTTGGQSSDSSYQPSLQNGLVNSIADSIASSIASIASSIAMSSNPIGGGSVGSGSSMESGNGNGGPSNASTSCPSGNDANGTGNGTGTNANGTGTGTNGGTNGTGTNGTGTNNYAVGHEDCINACNQNFAIPFEEAEEDEELSDAEQIVQDIENDVPPCADDLGVEVLDPNPDSICQDERGAYYDCIYANHDDESKCALEERAYFGCLQGDDSVEIEDVPEPSESEESEGNGAGSIQVDPKYCGGISGIHCGPGEFCEYEGDYPDADGICKPVPCEVPDSENNDICRTERDAFNLCIAGPGGGEEECKREEETLLKCLSGDQDSVGMEDDDVPKPSEESEEAVSEYQPPPGPCAPVEPCEENPTWCVEPVYMVPENVPPGPCAPVEEPVPGDEEMSDEDYVQGDDPSDSDDTSDLGASMADETLCLDIENEDPPPPPEPDICQDERGAYYDCVLANPHDKEKCKLEEDALVDCLSEGDNVRMEDVPEPPPVNDPSDYSYGGDEACPDGGGGSTGGGSTGGGSTGGGGADPAGPTDGGGGADPAGPTDGGGGADPAGPTDGGGAGPAPPTDGVNDPLGGIPPLPVDLPEDECMERCRRFREHERRNGCAGTVVCRRRPVPRDPAIQQPPKRRCVRVQRC